jgi:hypothetical protein
MHLISDAASQLDRKPELRGIIVNKATEFDEVELQTDRPVVHKLNLEAIEPSFRSLIMNEFSLRYSDTYPIPLDIDAVGAYKAQKIPYVTYPGCIFSYSTLVAFSSILKVVTVQWPREAIQNWNALADKISSAIQEENNAKISEVEEVHKLESENLRLGQQNEIYTQQLSELKETRQQNYEIEALRSDAASKERRRATALQIAGFVGVALLTIGLSISYTLELRRQANERQEELVRQIDILRRTADDRDRTLTDERQRFIDLLGQMNALRDDLRTLQKK